MINFFSEGDFKLLQQAEISDWIQVIIPSEGYELGEITYVFCNDTYLHKLNVDFLEHDTLTDIISFDYSLGKQIHGEIYISIDRVAENASTYNVSFIDELHRVIIHGVLHYCGFNDKTEAEAAAMRNKENEALSLRNFI